MKEKFEKWLVDVKKTDWYCKWFHKRGKLHCAFVDVVNGQEVYGYECECGKHFLTQGVFNHKWAFRTDITKGK